ncbi:hypothetical protein CHS0354_013759 [Potamilus streckersoni]|uniref:Uncharacterized protein n=1 Tax=Potamilus streckersoni TaxID=2493646 RepID=A0AAE0VWC1_9BIVA|nr:hypothetical protein CHS0354_013759 [Potamilus streckersoni]
MSEFNDALGGDVITTTGSEDVLPQKQLEAGVYYDIAIGTQTGQLYQEEDGAYNEPENEEEATVDEEQDKGGFGGREETLHGENVINLKRFVDHDL